ncbi:MAG: DUF2066 domain-containing protein [Nitrospinae bacterium]|nr:DUF2066 domain-containing protein [Nitrospinota bacterium]
MRTAFRLQIFWFINFLVFTLLALDHPFSWAQPILKDSYQGIASVSAKNDNYVISRKKAVAFAMKNAMELAFKDLLGEDEFAANQGDLKKIIRRASRYVKSYRYLRALDDLENRVSEVVLEVRFFPGAVNQALAGMGVVAGPLSEHKVVVLMKENSFTSAPLSSFWDVVPISETQLTKNFLESGIEVVDRSSIRDAIRESIVLGAIKGNLDDARNIGLKAGADIVIVGTAVSKMKKNKDKETKMVQVNISVKAVSAIDSSLIAAKSDFATVENEYELSAELEAFDVTSRKLADFLLPSFHRYWERGVQAPIKKAPDAPPMSMADM